VDALLVAIGGNAVHPESIKGTTEEQEDVADRAAQALVPLIKKSGRMLLTHGNGPVVGKILMRMMMTRHAIPPMRLDVCVAHSQGGIGYILIQSLENALRRAGLERQAACVVTQVEVERDDPAFGSPSKPIGPFFSEPEAKDLEAKGWRMMEDAGRGWRHCVPSPACRWCARRTAPTPASRRWWTRISPRPFSRARSASPTS
jgi:carbamate kinase